MIGSYSNWISRTRLVICAVCVASLLSTSSLLAQNLVPVTSRKTVGWGNSAGELPAPVNPQESMSIQELPAQEIDELPRYTGGPERRVETITQRYPDGKPQITRMVTQDETGNFLNHGQWKLFSQNGETMAEGSFKEGLMHGSWERWHPANSPGLFSEAPFNLYRGPWLSIANFRKGELDGSWTVSDRFRRKVFELSFKDGLRHGRATWYYPNNRPMREVDFKDGVLHGQMVEYDQKGKKTLDTNYVDGQELIVRKAFFFKDQQKAESNFLGAKTVYITKDDWWNAEPAQIEIQGQELKHGPTREWYPNGQLRLSGQYKQGLQVGSFRWWHPNGQKQIEGQYRAGKKVGTWTWHHANSQPAIRGGYESDSEVGVWRWWDENGKLEDERDFTRESLDIESLESLEGLEQMEAPSEEPDDGLNIDSDTEESDDKDT